MKYKFNYIYVILASYIILFFATTAFFNFSMRGEQQFSFLAHSFLHGKTYFLERPGTWEDVVSYNGYYYWHMGPFPAVLLMPFVYIFSLLNTFFFQGYLQFFITLGIFYLCFKIAGKIGFKSWDSLFLAFAFCFASVYQLIAFLPWSWYFVQAITVVLVLLAIFEYLGKRRYWLIGILFALILMSRFTAGIGILFFIAGILINKKYALKDKFRYVIILLIPSIIAGLLLLGYNHVRFGNIFENGYLLSNNATMTSAQRYEMLNYGLFQLRNIPTNIYYYFIKTLDPVLVNFKSLWGNTYVLRPPFVKVSYPGTSFFVVSPIFLYIFRTRIKEKVVKLSIIPSLVILFFLLTYYWPGWRQVGPRYMLDLMPFLYIILLYSFKNFKLSLFAKIIIFVSAILNLYFLQNIFSF